MGLDLPGPLETLLNDLGYTWPETDETDLFSTGSAWLNLGGTLGQIRQSADGAAQQVSTVNQGDAIEAFRQKWSGDNAPAKVLADATTGVELGGAALMLCAGVVLALKINTIVNLTILACEIAEAIATAVPTFGASLAEIPVFKEITDRIIQAIINEAVNAILG
ncbi:MAG TPA: hypothetical protein VFU35_07020 [Jatrophihabitans sp.]|nr:hypothetical protein [Jatrophihabitans sp.]